MLEKMAQFFEKRLADYDWHMLNEIESANQFYPYTASLLPKGENARLLDLGCGTGLELEFYLPANPKAHVTGIDLSQGMLDALKGKFPDHALNLICASYFDVPLPRHHFDACVSVESLHHFTKEEKIPLYKKVCQSLTEGGYLVLTDYFALSDEEERTHRETLHALKREAGITDDAFYHYDTPLTVSHETEALLQAGFASVQVMANWGATYTLLAKR